MTLPTLAERPRQAQPKPEPRTRTKGRKTRQEQAVKTSVRAQCVVRDGVCRAHWFERDLHGDTLDALCFLDFSCDGPSEWAHLRGHRRSTTRGQPPERRHTTQHSVMLCRHHHRMEEAGQLIITAHTRYGCDGPLRFRRRT